MNWVLKYWNDRIANWMFLSVLRNDGATWSTGVSSALKICSYYEARTLVDQLKDTIGNRLQMVSVDSELRLIKEMRETTGHCNDLYGLYGVWWN